MVLPMAQNLVALLVRLMGLWLELTTVDKKGST
jgi:hypothetical protein